jgi:uncharacterized membrane protein/predicted DsbA family dithiol-disulfide isomerase
MNRLTFQRCFALVALVLCVAMVIDQLSPVPKFCGFRGGCDAVLNSIYGRPLGIPISTVGLAAFAIFYLVSLGPPASVGGFVGFMAYFAGLVGIAGIAIQLLVLKRICPLCLAVDVLGILMAAFELIWPASQATAAPRRWVWLLLAIVGVALPPAWANMQPVPTVPDVVREIYQEGRINVVEITDFTCPHCRQTHVAVESLRRAAGDKIHFERIIAPLKNQPESRAAAQLYFLAKQHGQGERAAEMLFTAVDHSPAALRQYAGVLGITRAEVDQAENDPLYDTMFEKTLAWVERDAVAVPLVCIDELLLTGLQTEQSLQAALKRAQLQREATPPLQK